MRLNWSRKRVIWTIVLTVLATLLVLVIAANFATQ